MHSDKSIIRDGNRSLLRRVLIKVRERFSRRGRRALNENMTRQLEGAEFTLFTNNCIAGYVYHDAGRQFTTPTINLAFDAEEYIRFLEDPASYKDAPFEFYECPGLNYPVARVKDIEVRFVHYKTQEECIAKWRTRFERIVWENIFVIATDHDGMYEDKWKARFDKLPYQHKIMFVATETPQYEWEIPVRQFKGRRNVETLTSIADFKGQRYYETAFDLAQWIAEHSRAKGK